MSLLHKLRKRIPVERLKRMRRSFGRASRSIWEWEPPKTALISAARGGDVATLDRLIREGEPLEAKSDTGRTALHEAIRNARVEAAAFLLAKGITYTATDKKGRTAFDMVGDDFELLHSIRQRYHRFRIDERGRTTPAFLQAQAWADELERKGIIKVSDLINEEDLACLRRDFEGFVESLDRKLARGEGVYRNYDEEEHWWPNDRAYVTNNAFKYSETFIKLCCNEILVETARLFTGKPAYIQRGIGMRYLPSRSATNDMFGWHHDMEERRMKMMILLTDVGEGAQHMSYVIGSHKLYHPYQMFLRNPCSLDYVRERIPGIEFFNAVGRAGDVFLFDSNGAHRGNRSEDAGIRDVFIVEYSADPSEIWGADIDRSVFERIPLRGINPFERLLGAHKKWDQPYRRTGPSWVTNLPHVERWLGK